MAREDFVVQEMEYKFTRCWHLHAARIDHEWNDSMSKLLGVWFCVCAEISSRLCWRVFWVVLVSFSLLTILPPHVFASNVRPLDYFSVCVLLFISGFCKRHSKNHPLQSRFSSPRRANNILLIVFLEFMYASSSLFHPFAPKYDGLFSFLS